LKLELEEFKIKEKYVDKRDEAHHIGLKTWTIREKPQIELSFNFSS
jgi:hypothetical protein